MDVRKLHYLFFLASIALVFLRLLSNNQNSFSINVHDIYYVVGCADLYFFFAVFNALLGLVHLIFLLLKGSILRLFYQIHIYGTLIAQLLFFYYNYKNNLDNQFNIFDVMDYNAKMIYVLLIIILLQILLIINIFASLIKKLSNSHRDTVNQQLKK